MHTAQQSPLRLNPSPCQLRPRLCSPPRPRSTSFPLTRSHSIPRSPTWWPQSTQLEDPLLVSFHSTAFHRPCSPSPPPSYAPSPLSYQHMFSNLFFTPLPIFPIRRHSSGDHWNICCGRCSLQGPPRQPDHGPALWSHLQHHLHDCHTDQLRHLCPPYCQPQRSLRHQGAQHRQWIRHARPLSHHSPHLPVRTH